jgi:hypothetical protein
MKTITATVTRGKNKGALLTPHRYEDGHFLVCKGGNTLESAKRVYREDELESWIQRGYGIRMSGPGVSPSIYTAKSLKTKRN